MAQLMLRLWVQCKQYLGQKAEEGGSLYNRDTEDGFNRLTEDGDWRVTEEM